MERYFVCYYHEIILKRNNRDFFEKRLWKNVERALSGLPYRSIRRISGRLLLELSPDSPVEEIGARLQKVFGLVFCCPAWLSNQDMKRLQEDLWELVRRQEFRTFKIHARRANKKYPFTSPKMNELLGDVIRKRSKGTVRLDHPDLTCYVDIVEKYAFLYFRKLTGAKGLPVSSSGKVVVLLSGGIDSPVAAYKVMKRGCRVIFVHFHSLPYTTPESLEKVRRLVSILSQYQYHSKIYMVPFAHSQKQIVAFTPVQTRVILYRRLMMRLSEKIARRERAHALVTGESIGQVASQTLPNLRAISDVCELPILRPLIGDDKEEIIAVARRIGTFPISILPAEDCCSLFIPRHPETRAKLEGIKRVESRLDIDQMVEDTLKQLEIEKIEFQGEMESQAVSR
ncbi:tRNA 4-thiouridine(8) synthase ThiI [Acidobacteria bacterium AH-259-A15]|nr:tRNA 4-thiouridine(8) synthase ThiI [Acidobacteria bacterium AH-259-A15]